MMGPTPERIDLAKKIAAALAKPLSDAEFNAQKASFAYGNAPDSDYITKDSAVRAIHSFRLREVA